MLSNSTSTSKLARPAAIILFGTGALIHGFADPGTTLGIILLVVDLVLTLLAVMIIARGANAAAPALVVAYLALAIFMVALIIAWNRKQSSMWIPSGRRSSEPHRGSAPKELRSERAPGAPTTDPTSSTINVVLTVTSYTAKLAALALLLLPEHFSAKALESALGDRKPAYEDWPKSQSMPAAGKKELRAQRRSSRKGSEVTMNEAFVRIRDALRDFSGKLSQEQQRLAVKLFPENLGVQQDPSEMLTKLTSDKDISQTFSGLAFEMGYTTKCTVPPENPSTVTTNEYFLPLKSTKETGTMTELFGDFLQKETIDDDKNRLEGCDDNAFTREVKINPKGNFLLVYTIRSDGKQQSDGTLRWEPQYRVINNPWSDVQISDKTWYPIAWIHHTGSSNTSGHYKAYIAAPDGTYYEMNDSKVTKFDAEPEITQDQSHRLAYVLLCNDKAAYKELWMRRAGTDGKEPSGIPNIGNTCFANTLLQLLRLTPAFD
jgi:hypothetical protein